MRTKEQIISILQKELPYLQSHFNVKRIGIFGSYSRNENKRNSDLDLLVEYNTPPDFFEFLDLEDYLKEKIGIKIDLATPNALRPIIKNEILKDIVFV